MNPHEAEVRADVQTYIERLNHDIQNVFQLTATGMLSTSRRSKNTTHPRSTYLHALCTLMPRRKRVSLVVSTLHG